MAETGKPGRNWQDGKRWEQCWWFFSAENNGRTTAWTMPLSWKKNNGAIFDGMPSICYNVYNGWREKLYNVTESQETGKNAPVRRFAPAPYKITKNRQKRRTTNLHKIWEYKMA